MVKETHPHLLAYLYQPRVLGTHRSFNRTAQAVAAQESSLASQPHPYQELPLPEELPGLGLHLPHPLSPWSMHTHNTETLGEGSATLGLSFPSQLITKINHRCWDTGKHSGPKKHTQEGTRCQSSSQAPTNTWADLDSPSTIPTHKEVAE